MDQRRPTDRHPATRRLVEFLCRQQADRAEPTGVGGVAKEPPGQARQGNRRNASDQGDPSTCALHGAYYLKDRDSRFSSVQFSSVQFSSGQVMSIHHERCSTVIAGHKSTSISMQSSLHREGYSTACSAWCYGRHHWLRTRRSHRGLRMSIGHINRHTV